MFLWWSWLGTAKTTMYCLAADIESREVIKGHAGDTRDWFPSGPKAQAVLPTLPKVECGSSAGGEESEDRGDIEGS